MNIGGISFKQNAEGVDYRQLHPTKEGFRRWRYITKKDVTFRLEGIVLENERISFKDAEGRTWMVIDSESIVISKGYAWNGCSPKRWYGFLGWVGTVDFQETIYASLIHDALYQFNGTKHFPLDRKFCDLIFRRIIELCGSCFLARTYYRAVRSFGSWRGLGNGEESIYEKL